MKAKLMGILLVIAATPGFIISCNKISSSNGPQAAPSPTVTAKPLTNADLRKLRWIEGSWRGTGDDQAPFYERYKFENDSTLAVETLDGEKQDKVTDVTRFELKEGQFGGGSEGSRWVATALDDNSVTFEPVTKARNTFRWKRESDNSWKAVLNWPATDKGAAKQRVYRMERWPKP